MQNKGLAIIGLAVVGAAFLAHAMSNAPTVKTQAATQAAATQIPVTPTAPPATLEPPPPPPPPPAPPAPPAPMTLSEAEYRVQVNAITMELGPSLGRFADMMQSPKPTDPVFVAKSIAEAQTWQRDAAKAHALVPPPCMAGVNTSFVASADAAAQAATEYIPAVRALDVAWMRRAVVAMDKVAPLAKRADTQLQARPCG